MSECFISFLQLLKCQSDAKHLSVSCVYNGGTHETSFLKICFITASCFAPKLKEGEHSVQICFNRTCSQHTHNWILFDLEFIKLFSDSVIKQRKRLFFSFFFMNQWRQKNKTSKQSGFVVAVVVFVSEGWKICNNYVVVFQGWGECPKIPSSEFPNLNHFHFQAL